MMTIFTIMKATQNNIYIGDTSDYPGDSPETRPTEINLEYTLERATELMLFIICYIYIKSGKLRLEIGKRLKIKQVYISKKRSISSVNNNATTIQKTQGRVNRALTLS